MGGKGSPINLRKTFSLNPKFTDIPVGFNFSGEDP